MISLKENNLIRETAREEQKKRKAEKILSKDKNAKRLKEILEFDMEVSNDD